ncbi:MAG: pyruvate:ferredoxin (flavodoxin) oxidoreductase [Defluviitaleaceae bacterium]|nr:pyruvate:ferredoxin (flavodoxin) oxidoreductase [Defluviitaleaceae bacterium]
MALSMKTMDGNKAAAYASYAFTEVAAIYPITPSSTMAEEVDEWAAHGKTNIFGQEVRVVELQSEGGAAGAVHGSLAAGALTTTYTASQGLLLMIPNMYKIAGELLPGVLHVSARALAGHALSIFGDHSDVMACRQTGFVMLASSNVQECLDLGAISHLSSIKARLPFLHFFDGFRTSAETQKIEVWENEDIAPLLDMDALEAFRRNALNPEHPVVRGTAQNPDIFFQAKEASNKFYNEVPQIVEKYMEEINKRFNRGYKLYNYYGAPDADRVIIAMGSVCDSATEVVDYLTAKGEKVGIVNVHLFRPFVSDKFLEAIPKTAKKIAVLDRCKEPGSMGEPLYQDVCTAFFRNNEIPTIVGGRYGLGSKDVTPAQVLAVYDNLKLDKPKNNFTVGIVDDVTNTSLPLGENIDTTPEGTYSCKFWGLGADGTVGANKNSIKIIGDNTDMYTQAYFAYDSKKSGGITTSHLRFGKKRIHSAYLVKNADFVACHNQSYVDKYDMLTDIKKGGTFLLNTLWTPEELEANLPADIKKQIAEKGVKLYTINATDIAKELGLGGRVNTVLQAAFFKIANIIPIEDAVKHMKEEIEESYGSKGEKILNMNYAAVDEGVKRVVEISVPASWSGAAPVAAVTLDAPDFVKNVAFVMNSQKGDTLPVSTFIGREDGTFPMGTSEYEKRGIAVEVPVWIPENCIQCNQCSYVCPHASIRPFLLNAEEAKNAPAGFKKVKANGKGFEQYEYVMQLDTLDCNGCGVCRQVCPAKEKALGWEPIASQMHEMENWNYCLSLSKKPNPMNPETVKGSQFEQPLLEFSGACSGCGETQYVKLVTQLFGDRMYIANATGCSSIWGASAPSTPYCVNNKGQGPAWANSLFEDNAEYGYGMQLGVKELRNGIELKLKRLCEIDASESCKEAAKEWIKTKNDGKGSKAASAKLVEAFKNCGCSGEAKDIVGYVLRNADHLVKKSFWIVGGDGWAYDIGYGGLDHVIASGEDVNLLVMDTEVYSNTGGQASKATPTAAVAKFAASGMKIRKKDLGVQAMSYGYVYVAQIAMGADYNQAIKAIVEAENYPGPSIVIAYAPCIAHGISGGMGNTMLEAKRAVQSGYWHLYRFDPRLEEQGKNPFMLESKDPSDSFQDFIQSEVRYSSLKHSFPDAADHLFQAAEEDAKRRLQVYKRLAQPW